MCSGRYRPDSGNPFQHSECWGLGAQDDARTLACSDRQGRIDALALEYEAVAEALRIFVDAGDAEARSVIERLVHVGRQAPLVPRAQLRANLARGTPIGDFADPVEQVAGAAAAKK